MQARYQPRSAQAARLLDARSVALVGISSDADSIGRLVLSNLVRLGFPGEIHLVSRLAAQVEGLARVGAADRLEGAVPDVPARVPAARRGQRVDQDVHGAEAAQRIGIGLLVALTALALYNDLVRLFP